jgi:hypothetical protein
MEDERDALDAWFETAQDDEPETWPEPFRRVTEHMETHCWVAHDEPERPLAYGAWLVHRRPVSHR